MGTSIAILLSRLDHWSVLSIGSAWSHAGEELVEIDVASAVKAFGWARVCYLQYQDAWNASNASRWDPDGQEEIDEIDSRLAKLDKCPKGPSACVPEWAQSILDGVLPTDIPESAMADPRLLHLAEIAKGLNPA